jgi:hypothetical protein
MALDLNDSQSAQLTRAIRPGPQQRGLAAASRGRDERHLGLRRTIEGREKLTALNESRSGRTRRPVIGAGHHA